MAKKKKLSDYPAAAVATAYAGRKVGQAIGKAANAAAGAASKAGSTLGKAVKKAAGGRRQGPKDFTTPGPAKPGGYQRTVSQRKADKSVAGLQSAVEGMAPLRAARWLSGKSKKKK